MRILPSYVPVYFPSTMYSKRVVLSHLSGNFTHSVGVKFRSKITLFSSLWWLGYFGLTPIYKCGCMPEGGVKEIGCIMAWTVFLSNAVFFSVPFAERSSQPWWGEDEEGEANYCSSGDVIEENGASDSLTSLVASFLLHIRISPKMSTHKLCALSLIPKETEFQALLYYKWWFLSPINFYLVLCPFMDSLLSFGGLIHRHVRDFFKNCFVVYTWTFILHLRLSWLDLSWRDSGH